ncbi:MAG: D-Ala-D-Ala carboxypeptidase family metallohydrolase [Hyphomicrobium sp.]|jgi:hypothetical protein
MGLPSTRDPEAPDHFPPSEFACHDGCGLDGCDPKLHAALTELRVAAKAAVHVISGCRCKAHNDAVGSTDDSCHFSTAEKKTRAADVFVRGMPQTELYRLAAAIPAFAGGGIGIYPKRGFIHVDVRPGRARWGKIGARYTSFDEAWTLLKKEEGVA